MPQSDLYSFVLRPTQYSKKAQNTNSWVVHTASRSQFPHQHPRRGSRYVHSCFASSPSPGFLWAQDPAVPRETRGKLRPVRAPTHSLTPRKYSPEPLDEPAWSVSLGLAQPARPALLWARTTDSASPWAAAGPGRLSADKAPTRWRQV